MIIVIIFFNYQRHKSICSCCNFISKGQSKLSKILSKISERSVYWNEYKTKSETKTTTKEFRYFLESTFVGVNRILLLVHLKRGNDLNRFKTRRYHLPKDTIKNYYVIINGKNLFDQAIDSDINQYEEN